LEAVTMPNIAAALKDEIRRLARREIKAETGLTKQAVAQYRGDIAKLKRLVQAQQKDIGFLKAQERNRLGQHAIALTPDEQRSFWAALSEPPKLTASQRRLGSVMRGEA
jgi:hypothetical protein